MSDRWLINPKTYDYMLSPPEEIVIPEQGRARFQWDACEFEQFNANGDEIPVYALNIDWYAEDTNFEVHAVKCRGVWVTSLVPGGTRTIEPLTAAGCQWIERIFERCYDADPELQDLVKDHAHD